ncbi:YdcF family protein [Pseudogulbenkiania sp. MAI-1]|uniref:YdcF family protein n=1 Tax=Pseudogulbenkiania sp. MAI-1 TaxID=990370 RepID=UPI0004A2E5B2|nr:YdcF family protein [Pseudogulbenkiania sp. MAI-1]
MNATLGPGVLVHQLLGAFLLPPLNVILLLLLGLWLRRRHRFAGGLLLTLSLVLLYALATPRMAMWLSGSLERFPVVSPAEVRATGAIVVLGGGKKPAPEYGRNEPSADTLMRLRYAAHLARRSGRPLLVSGGAPLGGEPEGVVMARTLAEDYGVPPRWVEQGSDTTLDNARLSAQLLRADGVRSITLVSQGWHLSRAVPMFEQQGLTVLPAPTGFVRYDGSGPIWYLPSGRAMQETHAALREWVGRLYYAGRERLSGLSARLRS